MTLQINTTAGARDLTTNEQAEVRTGLGAAAATDLSVHSSSTSNPHGVTKAQVGLGSVDNTADANKPVSTAQAVAIGAAVTEHIDATDPHPGKYAPTDHTHTPASIGAATAAQGAKADAALAASADAIADALEAAATGAPADLARIQASVSGDYGYVRWCIPGKDGAGNSAKDISGLGNSAFAESSNSTFYSAADGRISTASGGLTGITLSAAAGAVDFGADSLIMSLSVSRADPAVSETIASWGGGASAANFAGLYVSHRSSAAGVARVVANLGNGTLVSGSDSAAKISNAGGTRDTSVLVAYDAPTRSVYLYRDGILAVANSGLLLGASAWVSTNPRAAPRLGGHAGTATTVAGSFSAWQGYVFTGSGLPLNVGEIACKIADAPTVPIKSGAFVFGTERQLIALVGQSNELGSGLAGSKSRVGAVGAPYVDPNQRGWWPTFIEYQARRGKWTDVANTAIGSTSLCDVWAGRCRAWSSGMVVNRGSYILSGGGIWKCNAAISVAVSSTVAPTGAANTTGADSVPWLYVGVPDAGDTDGAVYSFGSSRYDPNGYISSMLSGLAARTGYAQRGVYVSIGQGDHTVSSTRAQYSAAMQAVASHVTSLGYTCWLGVTIGMSGPDAGTIAARDATMTGVIQGGRNDALVALAGNPLVKAGADLRTELGVPTATTNDALRNAVNSTDYLHATSATYDQIGPIVAAAFAAGGW